MPLVTLNEILPQAMAGRYAVGAFNVHTLEIAQAIGRAAEELRAPVIFQVNQATLKYAGPAVISAAVRAVADGLSVPAVVHLDHGTSLETVMQCLRHGFTSVMIDASRLPYAENAALVRRVVEAAHAVGVSVEAELGHIAGTEDDVSGGGGYTDPKEAVRFVAETGVDALAVAIGTAHGVYKGTPKLDFDRLAELRRRLDLPLVLHGASGVPDEDVRRAVRAGVQKVNISTELKLAFTAAVRDSLATDPQEFDPRRYLGTAREAVTRAVASKLELLGAAGQGGKATRRVNTPPARTPPAPGG